MARTLGLHLTCATEPPHDPSRPVAGILFLRGGLCGVDTGSVEIRLEDVHDEKPEVDIRALIATARWAEAQSIAQETDLLLRDAKVAVPDAAPAEDAPTNVIHLS